MKTSLVLGLGFGDEGKGLTTSYLASLIPNSLVVRFNGGHQAGHTVVLGDKRHVFSSFGSGTLQNLPTLWSKHCTFYPIAFMNEYDKLRALGYEPQVFIDPLAPVTVPLDITRNMDDASASQHGSVGVGFGATLDRHEHFYKLHFQDLYNDSVLQQKLQIIKGHYYHNRLEEDARMAAFLLAVADIRKLKNVQFAEYMDFDAYDQIIFEGAQGILLDQDFGFFPFVTRSNTTSRNVHTFCAEYGLDSPEIFYVTRSYQTRHGNGPMTYEKQHPDLVNTELETNQTHPWQGEFRKGALDKELLTYAFRCDSNFSGPEIKKNLVVTCLDQTYGEIYMRIPDNSNLIRVQAQYLPNMVYPTVDINHVFESHSPDGTKIRRVL